MIRNKMIYKYMVVKLLPTVTSNSENFCTNAKETPYARASRQSENVATGE
jgi:hypothetical protein